MGKGPRALVPARFADLIGYIFAEFLPAAELVDEAGVERGLRGVAIGTLDPLGRGGSDAFDLHVGPRADDLLAVELPEIVVERLARGEAFGRGALLRKGFDRVLERPDLVDAHIDVQAV